MIPQLIYIAMTFIGVGMVISKHGEPKKNPNYNAGESIFASAIIWVLLYWGGFFDGFFR